MIRKAIRAAGICGFVGFTYYTYARIYSEIRTKPRGDVSRLRAAEGVKFTDSTGARYRLQELSTKYTVVAFGKLEGQLSLPGTYTLVTICPAGAEPPSSPGLLLTYSTPQELQSLLKSLKVPHGTSSAGTLAPLKPYTVLLNSTSEVVS